MKLKLGGKYLTRDGNLAEVVDILNTPGLPYPVSVRRYYGEDHINEPCVLLYTSSGYIWGPNETRPADIVGKWKDKKKSLLQRYGEFVEQSKFDTPFIRANPTVAWTMGMSGEAGEVSELVKKTIIRGKKDLDPNELALELGDVLFYLTACAQSQGLSLKQIINMNIDKLEKRAQDDSNVRHVE